MVTSARALPVLRSAALLFVLFAACAAPPAPGQRGSEESRAPSVGAPVGPKRIAAVIMGDPPAFTGAATPTGMSGSYPGLDSIEELVQAGLANYTNDGTLRPQLAAEIPSLDNGLWRLEGDGGMELTWRIRPGATWHDGVPVTADDFVFTALVAQDRVFPSFGGPAWGQVERVSASDASTVIVRWKQPFIHADALFTRTVTWPLPEHILGQTYRDHRDDFLQQPFWSHEFVGAGPFRVRELVGGSRIVLDAYDSYALGRPKIDGIDIIIVPDSNALVTHILANSSELTLGGRVSIDQATQVRDRWAEGRMVSNPSSLVATYPQFIGADPPVAANVQFLRALQYATDRAELVNTMMQGITEVADTTVAPNAREYADVQSAIVRYPYDPRRAAQLIEELGYVKGSDGIFRDSGGARLSVEARATAVSDIQPKALSAVAGYWRQVGVGVDEVVVPNQRVQDLEYRQTRPGFEVLSQSNDPEFFRGLRTSFHTAQIPLPQNNYAGGNRSRYSSPEMDARIEEYFATLEPARRLDVLRQIVRLAGEQLPIMGLFYNPSFVLVGNRLRMVGGRGPNSTETWNSEQWDAA